MGFESPWRADVGRQFSLAEEMAHVRRMAEAKALRDAALEKQHEVAENAGVHPATVYRFMQEDSKPLYETVKALSDYLTRQEAALNG